MSKLIDEGEHNCRLPTDAKGIEGVPDFYYLPLRSDILSCINDDTPGRYIAMIDLNRYSNGIARRVINAYNDIILDSVNQLCY